MTCKIELCPSCVISQHQPHKPLLMNNAFKELKDELINILNVQQREMLIQKKLDHLKNEISNYEKEMDLLKKKLENSKNSYKESEEELDSLKLYENKVNDIDNLDNLFQLKNTIPNSFKQILFKGECVGNFNFGYGTDTHIKPFESREGYLIYLCHGKITYIDKTFDKELKNLSYAIKWRFDNAIITKSGELIYNYGNIIIFDDQNGLNNNLKIYDAKKQVYIKSIKKEAHISSIEGLEFVIKKYEYMGLDKKPYTSVQQVEYIIYPNSLIETKDEKLAFVIKGEIIILDKDTYKTKSIKSDTEENGFLSETNDGYLIYGYNNKCKIWDRNGNCMNTFELQFIKFIVESKNNHLIFLVEIQ